MKYTIWCRSVCSSKKDDGLRPIAVETFTKDLLVQLTKRLENTYDRISNGFQQGPSETDLKNSFNYLEHDKFLRADNKDVPKIYPFYPMSYNTPSSLRYDQCSILQEEFNKKIRVALYFFTIGILPVISKSTK